jgi:hypothetical protein
MQDVNSSPIIQANTGGKAAGRDIIDSHNTYYGNSENVPSEFYVPKPKELKDRINIEALNFQRELKTFESLSGENKRRQFEVALKAIMNIWNNLLNPAKTVLKDTPIPGLIDDIYTQVTRFRLNWESLQGQYDEKNNWLVAVKTSHPEVVLINNSTVVF